VAAHPHTNVANILSTRISSNESVATSQWVELAESVARAAVEVPRSILEVTVDVIRGREAAAKWYGARGRGSEELAADSDRHVYSIGVLKEVHTILSSRLSGSPSKPASLTSCGDHTSRGPAPESETLSNLFELLQRGD